MNISWSLTTERPEDLEEPGWDNQEGSRIEEHKGKTQCYTGTRAHSANKKFKN